MIEHGLQCHWWRKWPNLMFCQNKTILGPYLKMSCWKWVFNTVWKYIPSSFILMVNFQKLDIPVQSYVHLKSPFERYRIEKLASKVTGFEIFLCNIPLGVIKITTFMIYDLNFDLKCSQYILDVCTLDMLCNSTAYCMMHHMPVIVRKSPKPWPEIIGTALLGCSTCDVWLMNCFLSNIYDGLF